MAAWHFGSRPSFFFLQSRHCYGIKLSMKSTLALLLALSLTTIAQAEEASKPSVFVAPLDGDTSQILGWQPALGEGLAEMLITELTRLNKFEVLESTALKELVDEIRLGEAGYVNEKEKVDKGGFAGADFMLRGKVTRFGSKSERIGLGGFVPGSVGNLGIKMNNSDVRIDWRLVDTYTRKIVKSGSVTAAEKGGGFDIGVGIKGTGGRIGYDNHEFMNSALGKAAAKAVTNVVHEVAAIDLPQSGRVKSKAQAQGQQDAAHQAATAAAKATPGKVLAVINKTTLVVSLGSKHGLKMGDKLMLYESFETKDDKGVVVFTEDKLVGEVTMDSVQEDRSKVIYGGDLEVKSGWTVKAK